MTPAIGIGIAPCFIRYRRGTSGPTPPGSAWALYLLNEGSGQTVGDSSGNGRDMYLGRTADTESSDPAWAVVDGVTCLEGAGYQICVAKEAATLAQPYSVVTLARAPSTSGVRIMLCRAYPSSGGYGLMRWWVAREVALQSDTVLTGAQTPNNTWFVGIGHADGASSKVWIYGDTVTSGSAGVAGITHHTLMGRWNGSEVADAWIGQLAAVAVLDGVRTEAELNAWAEYLAAVKGVTL